MTTFVKVAASIAGVVGAGTAVGVPVSLSMTGKTAHKNVELVQCEDQENTAGRQSVAFGNADHHAFCYQLTDASGEDLDTEEEDESGSETLSTELISFFKQNWSSGTHSDLATDYSNGKVSCGSGPNGGKLSSPDNNSVVLGNCKGEPESSSTERDNAIIFLEISNTNPKNSSREIKVCLQGKDCGSDSFDGQNIKEFKTPVVNLWKLINFYLNSV